MAEYGIKVAKKGYDVKTAPVDKLALDSEHPPPKVYAANAGSITIAQGEMPTITIPHNLGYIPVAIVFIEKAVGTDDRYIAMQPELGLDAPMWLFELDETNLYIRKHTTTIPDAGTYDYFYYIFHDPL